MVGYFVPSTLARTPGDFPAGWDTGIFLFGPGLLPDSDIRRGSVSLPNGDREYPGAPQRPQGDGGQEYRESVDSPRPSPASPGGESRPEKPSRGVAPENVGEQVPTVCFGTDLLTGGEVRWSLTVRGNPHLLVAGLPGMGKTTCLVSLCKQMLGVGIRPIVFSYHQDIDERLQI